MSEIQEEEEEIWPTTTQGDINDTLGDCLYRPSGSLYCH